MQEDLRFERAEMMPEVVCEVQQSPQGTVRARGSSVLREVPSEAW
jgi:hypothetical protein